MGQGCRYFTLWADGFNALPPHRESAPAIVLVLMDSPQDQRRFASSRGWRFRLASHGGGDCIREPGGLEGGDNYPGAVAYRRDGDAILSSSIRPITRNRTRRAGVYGIRPCRDEGLGDAPGPEGSAGVN